MWEKAVKFRLSLSLESSRGRRYGSGQIVFAPIHDEEQAKELAARLNEPPNPLKAAPQGGGR